MDIYSLSSRLDEIVHESEEFLHGQCHLFAIALKRLTSLPLAEVLDFDVECETTRLVHASPSSSRDSYRELQEVRRDRNDSSCQASIFRSCRN